ncbi:transcription factor bHLH144 [Lactuca sativa]|uniref:transcription factor bHLH144 n=1 Tax=Lactuca sativa TaxID=4236 RepID=UPI000CD8405E|nr:transcription factor bHLH144 [Lactuca sativa]
MGSGYFPDRNLSSFFGQNVDFQPARDCPRNFIIFDRTDNQSRIVYHPDTTTSTMPVRKDENAPGVMNEDLADIDALLSLEDEEEEYEEGDDVSTGRTGGYDGSDTSDTCSSSRRNGGPGVFLGYEVKDSERKRDKMKKMVKSLKGIVPGVNGGMNTVDVLDEAVKYLKSLKVEAQKMGVGDFQG